MTTRIHPIIANVRAILNDALHPDNSSSLLYRSIRLQANAPLRNTKDARGIHTAIIDKIRVFRETWQNGELLTPKRVREINDRIQARPIPPIPPELIDRLTRIGNRSKLAKAATQSKWS